MGPNLADPQRLAVGIKSSAKVIRNLLVTFSLIVLVKLAAALSVTAVGVTVIRVY